MLQVSYSDGPTTTRSKPKIDWESLAAKCTEDVGDQLIYLANTLRVPVRSLQAIGVGFGHLNGSDCWTLPECNASGKTIGIQRRRVAGGKRMAYGSSRGLTIAPDWQSRPGPILLVEGGTDTAACHAMGLSAIGRPGLGGAELIAELLQGVDRDVIVVGENDRKSEVRTSKQVKHRDDCEGCTYCWPGKAGAKLTAEKLAEALGRPVRWALTPNGQKDPRSWLNARNPDLDDPEVLHQLGQRFLDGVEAESWTVEPPETIDVEAYQPPAGEVQDLDRWRENMVQARVESLSQPGIYFDGSPTGAGKSYADREAIRQAEKSLIGVPTHANCRELAADLQSVGIDAVAYPQRTEDNCLEFDWVQQIQAVGLSPGAAYCPSCPHHLDCSYLIVRNTARDADHAIATHDRISKDTVKVSQGKRFVAIHENADNLLQPVIQFYPDPRSLAAIAEVAWLAKDAELKRDQVDVEVIELLDLIRQVAEEVIPDLVEKAETTAVIPITRSRKKPAGWQRKLWRAITAHYRDTSGKITTPIDGNAMRTVLGLVFGDMDRLVIKVDYVKGSSGTRQLHKTVLGVWRPQVPENAPWWFADATGSANTIQALIGREIHNKTPEGRLGALQAVRQYPRSIWRSTSLEAVAGWVEAILAKHPEAKKIGVIGHRRHVRALTRSRRLDQGTRDRIVQTAYFGEGPDKASNSWHADCDLLLVIGTPNVGDAGIRDHLIRIEANEAAGGDGRWDDRQWEGRTEVGKSVVIQTRGYRDPTWRRAHRNMVVARLRQAIGRGRTILPAGIPTIVITSEDVGVPVAENQDIWGVSKRVREAARVVFNSVVAFKKYIKSQRTFDGVGRQAVAKDLGVDPTQAGRLLKQAAKAGLVTRVGHGKWALAGDHPPPAAGPPEDLDGMIESDVEMIDDDPPAQPPEDMTPDEVEAWDERAAMNEQPIGGGFIRAVAGGGHPAARSSLAFAAGLAGPK